MWIVFLFIGLCISIFLAESFARFTQRCLLLNIHISTSSSFANVINILRISYLLESKILIFSYLVIVSLLHWLLHEIAWWLDLTLKHRHLSGHHLHWTLSRLSNRHLNHSWLNWHHDLPRVNHLSIVKIHRVLLWLTLTLIHWHFLLDLRSIHLWEVIQSHLTKLCHTSCTHFSSFFTLAFFVSLFFLQ